MELGMLDRGLNLNRGLCRIDLRIRCCLVLSSQVRQRIDRGMSLRLRCCQSLSGLISTIGVLSPGFSLMDLLHRIGRIYLGVEGCLVLSSQVRQRIDRGMSLRLGIAQRLQLISELLDLFRSLRFLAMILQMLLLA